MIMFNHLSMHERFDKRENTYRWAKYLWEAVKRCRPSLPYPTTFRNPSVLNSNRKESCVCLQPLCRSSLVFFPTTQHSLFISPGNVDSCVSQKICVQLLRVDICIYFSLVTSSCFIFVRMSCWHYESSDPVAIVCRGMTNVHMVYHFTITSLVIKYRDTNDVVISSGCCSMSCPFSWSFTPVGPIFNIEINR